MSQPEAPAPQNKNQVLEIGQALLALVNAPSVVAALALRTQPAGTRLKIGGASLLLAGIIALLTKMPPALGLAVALLHLGRDLIQHTPTGWGTLLLWALPTWLCALPLALWLLATEEIKGRGERVRHIREHGKTQGDGFDLGDGFHISWAELGTHGLTTGTTGSGKTTTVLRIISEAIAYGKNCLVIDGKGDADLADTLAGICEANGRPFVLWTLENQQAYNPLAQGDPTSLADRLVGSLVKGEGAAEYYHAQAEAYALRLFLLLQEQGITPTLAKVRELLDPRHLKAFALYSPNQATRGAVLDYLEGLTASEKSAISGLAGYLDQLVLSGAPGKWGEGVSLADALDGTVILFSVGSLKYGRFSPVLGAMLLSELLFVGDTRANCNLLAVIDEFSSFRGVERPILDLLAKIRSRGVSLLLSTQSLLDFDRISPQMAGQVVENTNCYFIHQTNEATTAEAWAKNIGTQTTLATTERVSGGQATGEQSARMVEAYLAHPNTLKRLAIGQCVAVVKKPRPRWAVIRVKRTNQNAPRRLANLRQV